MSDGNVSAQNNVTTAAEYQAAADEITAIINTQRAERAPIEAEQVLLQNRAELLLRRQQQALNTLRAAEADPNDTAFLEQSRLAYNTATNEVNAVNTAIQQNRSVLAQSRQSTAELQEQRGALEVKAEFAEQGPPNQNSLPPPATTVPDQTATFVPTPPGPIPPTVTPALQPAAATPTATASAQNNVTTAAEYQQAADEITEIINVQRAERAPIEAQQELLRNRQELLISRQQSALNTLQAAEADPSDTAFLEASRTAYARATGEVEATNFAIQQNRSVLAQSRQATAELQDQRGNLEVNAELAARGAPTLNSLPPPATVIPDQSATFVPTPAQPTPLELSPPLLSDAELLAIYPETDPQEVGAIRGTTIISDEARRIMSDPAVIAQQQAINATALSPVPPTVTARALTDEEVGRLFEEAETPPAQNNVSVSNQWLDTENQIAAASRSVRAENVAATENLASLRSEYNQVTQADEALKSQIAIAQRSGASAAEIERLEERRGETFARTAELERQINRNESVIAQNQETLAQLDQQRFIAEEAQFVASSGPAGLNSTPGPATDQPDLDPAAYDLPPTTYAQSFQASAISADGDEAIQAYDEALLAQQEGRAFAQPEISASGDEALQAYEDALLAQQEGRAFAQVPDVPASGDEALQAYDEAVFAQTEGRAFATQPRELNDPLYGLSPEQIQALGGADPTDPYIRARLGIPQLPGSELTATPGFGTIRTGVPIIDNALSFLGGLFGPRTPPTPAAAAVDPVVNGLDLPAEEPVNGLDLPAEVGAANDAELQAIQDAEAQLLAEQEGRAFPPVADAAPVTGDEAITAFEDAQAAELAAAEGSAFAEPAPVSTLDDPEARAIQDAVDADLAAQEGLAFPPVENPAPVDPNDTVTQFEDVQAAELAAQEGAAFAVDEPLPVDVGSDEELRAIEDAQAADLAAQEGSAFAAPVDVGSDAELQAIEDAQAADLAAQEGTAFAEPVATNTDPALGAATAEEQAAINAAISANEEAAAEAAARQRAKEQAVLQARYKQPSTTDWRVRLVLAEGSTYLYNADPPGVLAPLAASNGVIFPYTPQIQTAYQAQYDQYDLIHSNFRGVFYKNSKVNDISIRATFTAQDTKEANYLLAVIHFFRSVTKMFYGQDQERGTPPPLVYLVGYGDLQFAGHPCLVSQFNYTLPNDVDYIRALAPNNYGQNLLGRRAAPLSAPSPSAGQQARRAILSSVGIQPGAVPKQLVPSNVVQSVNNTERATYVPTKMEIDINLIPVNTRNQISKGFSFKEFANGNLVKKGYW